MATRFDPADLGLDSYKRKFIPNMISREHMPKIFENVPESVKYYARDLRDSEWRFYSVSQSRGTCYADHKVITIPVWVIDRRDLGEKIWYISHEIAHAYDGCIHEHGPEFMEWLKRICPQEYWHYELGYKPRNAKAAGIRNPAEVEFKLVDL